MILLEPLFPGENSIDQLIEIMKVLGSPTLEEVETFKVQNVNDFRFPQVKAHPWSKVPIKYNWQVFLKYKPDMMLTELIKRMLVYVPHKRLKPYEALQHAYFDDLRD
jgi:glycogen synthase kinase 3 beta